MIPALAQTVASSYQNDDEPDVPFMSDTAAMDSLRTLARGAANNHERNLAKYLVRRIPKLKRELKKMRERAENAEDALRLSAANARAIYRMKR
jgi:hypothetical protein